MLEIFHITSPFKAINIAEKRRYKSLNEYGGYDAGMNFIGELGEYRNTQPKGRGAKLHVIWRGEISDPVQFDECNCNRPNVLYDYNGSGEHFPNNDPRYFLPYGSSGLRVTKIEFENEEALIEGWAHYKKSWPLWLYNKKLFKPLLKRLALTSQRRLNQAINAGEVVIDICRQR